MERDVGITVGSFGVETSKGPLYLYACVQVDFGRELPGAPPDRLTLTWEDRHYRAFKPGHEDTPFFDLVGVDEEAHERFQRLLTHWGHWFMRVAGAGKWADFQVRNASDQIRSGLRYEQGMVCQLVDRLDRTLDVLYMTHGEAIEAAIVQLRSNMGPYYQSAGAAGGDVDGAIRTTALDLVFKLEELTGPLPLFGPNERIVPSTTLPVTMTDVAAASPALDFAFGLTQQGRVAQRVTGESVKEADPKRSRHEHIIDTYLTVLFTMARLAREERDPEKAQNARSAYTALRDARIYEITVDDFSVLQQMSGAYIASALNVDFNDIPVDFDVRVDHAAVDVPFPAPLPFPSIYIAWGDIPAVDVATDTETGDMLVGALICEGDDGVILEFGRSGVELVVFRKYRREVKWGTRVMSSPWFYTMLVEALNDHRTIINQQSRLKTKMAFKQAGKGRRKQYLPRPYYTITLTDRVVQDLPDATKTRLSMPREWTHRWDVEGHERIYVRRGPLPLAPDRKARYLADEWAVFQHPRELSGEAYGAIIRRAAKPMGVGEWMAVKRVWIDNYQKPKGRDDLPYVPAVRKPGKGVAR